jgi:hypothetical protein
MARLQAAGRRLIGALQNQRSPAAEKSVYAACANLSEASYSNRTLSALARGKRVPVEAAS